MQDAAVLAAADSKYRFFLMNAPTAFGKSLAYTCTGLLTTARTCINTSTNALMEQLHGDYSEIGLQRIRGLGNYECIEGGPMGRFGDMKREGFRAERGIPMSCDEAPCQAGAYCPKRDAGCL